MIYGRTPSSAPTTDFFSSSYLGSNEGVVVNGKLLTKESINSKKHIESKEYIAAAEYVKVGITTASCTASLAGALRYRSNQIEFCNGSSWTALTGGEDETTYSSCSSTTRSNCSLKSTGHGGDSGSCASGYTGSCSYNCNNGTWSQQSNSCSANKNCSSDSFRFIKKLTKGGQKIAICDISAATHGQVVTGSCISNHVNIGHCTYQCDNGTWIKETGCF